VSYNSYKLFFKFIFKTLAKIVFRGIKLLFKWYIRIITITSKLLLLKYIKSIWYALIYDMGM